MKNEMDKNKITMLETQFCSAYKLYLQSMRDNNCKSERAENLSRYQAVRRVLEVLEYTDTDIEKLEHEVEKEPFVITDEKGTLCKSNDKNIHSCIVSTCFHPYKKEEELLILDGIRKCVLRYATGIKRDDPITAKSEEWCIQYRNYLNYKMMEIENAHSPWFKIGEKKPDIIVKQDEEFTYYKRCYEESVRVVIKGSNNRLYFSVMCRDSYLYNDGKTVFEPWKWYIEETDEFLSVKETDWWFQVPESV